MQCALGEEWACDGGCALREGCVTFGVALERRGAMVGTAEFNG